jgi:hypothetical protein
MWAQVQEAVEGGTLVTVERREVERVEWSDTAGQW